MVVVVDHELGHPAIDSEILSGDEAGCVVAEETDHLYDIIRQYRHGRRDAAGDPRLQSG